MNLQFQAGRVDLQARAKLSGGASNEAIYRMVAQALHRRHRGGGTLIDAGCGAAKLWRFVAAQFDCYIGVDAVRYPAFPAQARFVPADLNHCVRTLNDAVADAVVAVETIEHLENPRAFMRELVRLVRPGGWVFVTTPNQLSLLSLMCLALRRRFAQFQDVDYPAHLTALLETDLRRIAYECRLEDVCIEYSAHGRVMFTNLHYPHALSRLFCRALSDNVMIAGQRPL